MVLATKFLAFVAASLSLVGAAVLEESHRAPVDPCATVAGKKWVSPKEVRACYQSIKVDETLKGNIIEVITKSLAFHTSTNYEIRAPQPFTNDVHEDILADLARIKYTQYASDYDLHIELSRALKRMNDGHVVWDSAFVNYLPLPLSLITAKDGSQNVHISPEAFTVASAEFPDQIQFWQDSLNWPLTGKLQSLAGAKVLLINGRPPFDEVNDNAAIAGSYQSLATRQNGFFSSYVAASAGWAYLLGQFAQQSLPLSDNAVLTIQREGHLFPEIVN
ncbi:hypothetical protein DXG03_001827, partial [Asterophora parasitica]